jgi:hypothetical protein
MDHTQHITDLVQTTRPPAARNTGQSQTLDRNSHDSMRSNAAELAFRRVAGVGHAAEGWPRI